MAFFDPNSAADLALLNAQIRTNTELENVASRIEWEVINAFTQRDLVAIGTYDAFFDYEFGVGPDDELKVRLVGYDPTNPDNSDAGLKQVLRRTIADMISWTLMTYSNAPGVVSKTQGNRSVSFNGAYMPSWGDFPPDWDAKLKNYDARIARYGI